MKRVASIELLRFISSLMVIIWHYQQFFLPFNPFSEKEILTNNRLNQPFYDYLNLFYNYGNKGVDFFFIISGFVFAFVYLSNKNKINSKFFFVNRFARLYPLHFLTLIIVFFLQFYSNENFNTYIIHFLNDSYHFILNILFVSGWGFEKGLSFNGPIWSVSIEIIIYFIFFIIILSSQNNQFLKSVLLVIFFLTLRKLSDFQFISLINAKLLNCGLLFFEGVLVYYLSKKIKNNTMFFLFGLAMFSLSLTGNFKIYLFLPSVIIIFLSFERFINQKLNNFFCFLGNLTYGTYLWHVPLQILIVIIMKKQEINFSSIELETFFLLYLTSLFIISMVSYYVFEKKVRVLIRSKFSN